MFLIVAEDAAALMGISVAFAGIVLQQILHSATPDAIASIVVGGILGTVAAFMAIETHALILGESADPEIVAGIVNIVRKNPNVLVVHTPLTMHFGPDEILVNMAVEFRPDMPAEVILDCISEFESGSGQNFPGSAVFL